MFSTLLPSSSTHRDIGSVRPPCAQCGVMLIESLIALLVLSIALLGVASLQLLTQREEAEARWRSIAVTMSGDLIEQLRIDRMAADGLEIQNNVLSGCSAPNQWLCNLIGDWQEAVSDQLPNATTQLQLDDLGDDFMLATVSIVWRRIAAQQANRVCIPQDDDAGPVIIDGGCIRVETVL